MKKFFELIKLNREIKRIRRELMPKPQPLVNSGMIYFSSQQSAPFRDSEKSVILRNGLNKLLDERELLRRK